MITYLRSSRQRRNRRKQECGKADNEPERRREAACRVTEGAEDERADRTNRVSEPEHHPDKGADPGDIVLQVERQLS